MSLKTGLALIVTAYALIRLQSYIFEPKPYLWWHGLLDFVVLGFLCLSAWAQWKALDNGQK